jgi:hypothetical protein
MPSAEERESPAGGTFISPKEDAGAQAHAAALSGCCRALRRPETANWAEMDEPSRRSTVLVGYANSTGRVR